MTAPGFLFTLPPTPALSLPMYFALFASQKFARSRAKRESHWGIKGGSSSTFRSFLSQYNVLHCALRASLSPKITHQTRLLFSYNLFNSQYLPPELPSTSLRVATASQGRGVVTDSPHCFLPPFYPYFNNPPNDPKPSEWDADTSKAPLASLLEDRLRLLTEQAMVSLLSLLWKRLSRLSQRSTRTTLFRQKTTSPKVLMSPNPRTLVLHSAKVERQWTPLAMIHLLLLLPASTYRHSDFYRSSN